MKMEIKAAYTVAELARYAGISAERTRRLIKESGVVLRPRGKRTDLVFLSDIKNKMPEFWEACLDCAALATGR